MATSSKVEKEQAKERIVLLFLGTRPSPDKPKKVWMWYEIQEDENNGDPLKHEKERERLYSGKNLTVGTFPGTIVSIDQTLDAKSVYPGSARIIGSWKCDDDVVAWRAESRAIEGEIEYDQRVNAEIRRDVPDEYLEPFRLAYQRCKNRRQKTQLIAWVIEQIMRGS